MGETKPYRWFWSQVQRWLLSRSDREEDNLQSGMASPVPKRGDRLVIKCAILAWLHCFSAVDGWRMLMTFHSCVMTCVEAHDSSACYHGGVHIHHARMSYPRCIGSMWRSVACNKLQLVGAVRL